MKKFFALAFVATLAMPLFAADGAATFKAKCAMCHGPDGSRAGMSQPINTDAVKAKGEATLTSEVTKGVGKMPAFEGKLSPEEISATVAYVLTLK